MRERGDPPGSPRRTAISWLDRLICGKAGRSAPGGSRSSARPRSEEKAMARATARSEQQGDERRVPASPALRTPAPLAAARPRAPAGARGDRGLGARRRQVLRRGARARRRRPRGRAPARCSACSGPTARARRRSIRILTTLLKPDAGTATVAGLDVVRDAAALRERIGLAGQYAAVDENLTGAENLDDGGPPLRRCRARRRASARHRSCSSASTSPTRAAARRRRYSGGMRRRLDLARGARRRPAGPVPRRADHRARPAQPPAAVGDDRGARRRGHDRAADHAVPRRGRPARGPRSPSSTTAA